MADDPSYHAPYDELPAEEDEGPVLPRRPVRDTAEMDITPMIDIVFLLLIFFLVCSTATMQSAVHLPPARHGVGISDRASTIVTVLPRGAPGPPLVYLADGRKGAPLPDDQALQREDIAAAVEQGLAEGKPNGMVKAAGDVKLGDLWPVYTALGQVEGAKLHVAVEEVE
jgi:biopolymer transport protein ExbD